jgi:hypothetical protein
MVWVVTLASLISCSAARAADGPHMQLIGTVQASDGGLIIGRNTSSGQTFSLKNGSNFEGWTLTDIGRDDATFEKASTSAKIQILSPINPGSTPMPVAAPQTTAATAPIAPVSPPPSPSEVPKRKWVDGDGQIIDPPR